MAETHIDFNKVDEEEYELQSSVLQNEVDQIKKGLAVQKNHGSYVPLNVLKRIGSLSVTDVCGGMWCEVQVEYQHLHPWLTHSREWRKMSAKGRPVSRNTKTMTQGASIHLKRELEVHERVYVPTITKEDKWAVQLLTMYQQLSTIKDGGLEREISVFGDPFHHGTVINGIIDQIQYCPRDDSLVLLEFKTRKTPTLPQAEQLRGHQLQLMIYKLLFDNITQGVTDYKSTFKLMGLNLDIALSLGPLQFLERLHLADLISHQPDLPSIVTFEQIADLIQQQLHDLHLPPVSVLLLHYQHQSSKQELGIELVVHDQDWARKEVERSLEFWLGLRTAHGVDIEESWKCSSCQFTEVCVWKRQQQTRHS